MFFLFGTKEKLIYNDSGKFYCPICRKNIANIQSIKEIDISPFFSSAFFALKNWERYYNANPAKIISRWMSWTWISSLPLN